MSQRRNQKKKKKLRNILEKNENGNTIYENLWNVTIAVLRRMLIEINV